MITKSQSDPDMSPCM